MFNSPGFVYLSTEQFHKLCWHGGHYDGDKLISVPNFSYIKTNHSYYSLKENTSNPVIKFYSTSIYVTTLNGTAISQFMIVYSDEKEFNKFKKENPELQYDTFDNILEIEKDYDNEQDFRNDFKDRIKNMTHY